MQIVYFLLSFNKENIEHLLCDTHYSRQGGDSSERKEQDFSFAFKALILRKNHCDKEEKKGGA